MSTVWFFYGGSRIARSRLNNVPAIGSEVQDGSTYYRVDNVRLVLDSSPRPHFEVTLTKIGEQSS